MTVFSPKAIFSPLWKVFYESYLCHRKATAIHSFRQKKSWHKETLLPFSNSLWFNILNVVLLFMVQYKVWLWNENKWSKFIDVPGKIGILLFFFFLQFQAVFRHPAGNNLEFQKPSFMVRNIGKPTSQNALLFGLAWLYWKMRNVL